MYYSQQGEDEYLYENFLNYKDGFFIEIGAMDGNTFSNTKFFEDELNWNGILIEPTNQFEKLIINRSKCCNFNYAVSEIDGYIDFIGHSAIGGILNTLPENNKKWIPIEMKPFKVKSIPFYKIIKNIDIKRVDLFSIDVEGGELEVLTTFDWNIPVYLILIEMNGNNIEKDNKCRELLKIKNFKLNCRLGLNEVWINKKNEK